ncbi:aromatic acid exporter family protein [Enterococcus hirae]|uniref:FUSC family protein n=1 Tax=Enterococcus hirae TaxID=1354 RepID=UPI0025437921|nr:aromatic acid exporter family protein [Enterococcus hirae]EMF0036132.1 FUSC family protein [Enterococcus hirae]EMF0047252.1 FUSC family protein [Enterococcus hirae]EMF0085681.1 FUSC family protein [Enterococcus hirae]EMF0157851.1 FUSC family protein [Enterococcus hirae]EMF0507506.1 FUSC family protein [Enterococcus hirae]
MEFGRFRLGMRTIKSALAVFLCILFFHVTDRGLPMIAALSAVFSLRQDLTTTLSFGRSRIIGNSIGGFLGIIYFLVKNYFHNDFLVELFLLPVLVVIVIVVSDGINNNSGIISAIATLLLIALSVPQGESSLYAIQRVLDTFIGTFIAIGINFFLRPPETEKKEELVEDLVELQKKEALLRENLAEVEEQIKKHKNS